MTCQERCLSGKMPTFSMELQKKSQVWRWRHNTNATCNSYRIYNRICSRAERAAPVKNRKITVENLNFSTLSTDFSTGGIHSRMEKSVCILVYISCFDCLRQFCHFFASYHFHKEKNSAEKKVLTSVAYR